MPRVRTSTTVTTPLHAAAHGNRKDVVQVLIEPGANLNAKNKSGRTPLGETEFHNATAAAKLLREAGAPNKRYATRPRFDIAPATRYQFEIPWEVCRL
jgi:ankyrin repeat protein